MQYLTAVLRLNICRKNDAIEVFLLLKTRKMLFKITMIRYINLFSNNGTNSQINISGGQKLT